MAPEQPEESIKLQQLFLEILGGVNDEVRDDLDRYFGGPLKTGTWAWEPKITKLSAEKVHRLSDMFSGPAFCCEGYEWPELHGRELLHIIQLNLRGCGEVGGVDLGSGLLQVFSTGGYKNLLIRVIPEEYAALENALPWPDFGESNGRITDYLNVRQIKGYKPKRFTSQLKSSTIQSIFKTSDLTSEESILRKIREFDRIVKSKEKKWDPAGSHLFGTFYDIQYSAEERDSPLFCLDSDHGMLWGDCGTAQVFYKRKEGVGLEFYFDWSCH